MRWPNWPHSLILTATTFSVAPFWGDYILKNWFFPEAISILIQAKILINQPINVTPNVEWLGDRTEVKINPRLRVEFNVTRLKVLNKPVKSQAKKSKNNLDSLDNHVLTTSSYVFNICLYLELSLNVPYLSPLSSDG